MNIEWLKAEFDEANEICFFYLNSESRETFEELKKIVEQAPSIDIVHCRECKYASDNKVYGCMLNHFNDNDYDYHRMYADDFCSCGVKKGADDE